MKRFLHSLRLINIRSDLLLVFHLMEVVRETNTTINYDRNNKRSRQLIEPTRELEATDKIRLDVDE